jgi:hypothetical protein
MSSLNCILFWICLVSVRKISVASAPINIKELGSLKFYLKHRNTMKILSIININIILVLLLPITILNSNTSTSLNDVDNNGIGYPEFISDSTENRNKEPIQTSSNLRMNTTGALLWKATAETGNLSEWSPGGGNYKMNANRVLFSDASKERAKSGSFSYKLTVDAGTDMASTQLFRYSVDGQPNSNKDAIYSAWYFLPQKVDFYGVSWHNMMQWKVKTTSSRSHPIFTMGLGVSGGKGSRGDNFIELRNTGEWFPGGSSFNYQPLNTLPIPIGKWFKIEARYIHGSNGNGRVMIWQGDLEGNDTLIYDISNVTTYPSKDRDGLSTTELSWSVNNYTARTIPAVTTIYIDDASIHLPGTTTSPSPIINIDANPKEGGKVRIVGNE